MWIAGMVLLYLGGLVLWDVKKRELPVKALLCGGILAVGVAAYRIASGEGDVLELLLGAVPGIVLLSLAWLTRAVGIGDALVLLQLDLCLFFEKMIVAFGISLMVIGAFAIVCLLLRRGSRQLRLPYMPFLWVGCLCAWIICG